MDEPGRSEKPTYRVIADELRTLIRESIVPPGGQLPTEQELAEQYGVARGTVRRAYEELTREGRVISTTRAGYFVPPQVEPLTLEMSGPGAPARLQDDIADRASESVTVRIASAAEEIRGVSVGEMLGLPANASVVVRDRLYRVGGTPAGVTRSYCPYDLAKDSAIAQPGVVESICLLLSELGYQRDGAEYAVVTRSPNAEERRLLGLEGLTVSVADVLQRVWFRPDQRILLIRHSVIVGGPERVLVWTETS